MGKKKRPPLIPVAGPVIDSHAHLTHRTFGDDVDAIIEKAFASGITEIVNIGAGYGIEGIPETLAVADRHERVFATVGIHPHDAKELAEDPSRYDALRTYASHPKVVAFGEVGLDFYYNNSSPEAQRGALRGQIRLAKELKLPLIVHDRDAHEEIINTFDEEGGWDNGVVIHCFSGDYKFAEACIERGAMISFSGIVTFKTAPDIREAALRIPEAHIMVETDSPFLAPHPYRGRKNEPFYVHQVLREVANLRGMSEVDLAHISTTNSRRFYGITPAN